MFAHKEFADFSQEIGLASLGADEREIDRLAAIYWFTVEFGLCLERGERKVYGAGILSSFGELPYSMSEKPKVYEFDPYEIAQNHLNYPISSLQPIYFQAESFEKSNEQIRTYCEGIKRKFNCTYDKKTQTINVDRKIKTR